MVQALLEKLITFPTVSANKEENKKALAWVEKELKGLPLYITRIESNGFPSLVVTTQKTKKPTLWLQAHMDVVDGSPEVFKPKIVKGRLYGRGTSDMKFAIAVFIQIFKDLGKDLKNYNIGMMLTCDEEIGGFNGVKAVLEKGYSGTICFLPDGGQDWYFQKWAKGILHILVESKGKSAHGSRPWLGNNAINQLMAFLTELQTQFPKEPCKKKDHYHNTLNIGKIDGGFTTNQIAENAQAKLDIRYIPETTKAVLLKQVKLVAKKYPSITVKEIISGSSYISDINNPYLKMFSKIAKDMFKIKTKLTFSHGSSDARFFIDKGIPSILIRPAGGDLHAEKEWIDIKDLERFYLVTKEFVIQVGGK